MATKKQLMPLMANYVSKNCPELLNDDSFDLENRFDFDIILDEILLEECLCNGCRHYYSSDRTCENVSNLRRTCINRAYRYLKEGYAA